MSFSARNSGVLKTVAVGFAALGLSACSLSPTPAETAEADGPATVSTAQLDQTQVGPEKPPQASFSDMTPQERFQALSSGPRQTHCDDPVPNPVMTDLNLYDGATPPPCSTNVHGQVEVLNGGVEATHWFVEADGVTWHFVTAGDPENEAVIFLHGLPESWYGFNHQMAALSDSYFTISIDQMGYGQTDKRLDLDYSNAAMAKKLAALIDTLGLESFYAVGHDRGAVTFDYLMAVDGMPERITKYVRMQQSGNRPHGEPRPPHELFASQAGIEMFARELQLRVLYTTQSGYSSVNVDADEVDRLAYEFLYEGAAEAISKYFASTNFDVELEDRVKDGGLFDQMTMPVLFLQGALDPGQHPEEYLFLDEDVADHTLIVVEDASHFMHVERPEKTTQIIRDFFSSE
ncbi:MAG: alpha/beta hydrolase [Pseudomonadota bacterium]